MLDGGDAIRKLVLQAARISGMASLARPFLGGVGAILMLHRVTAASTSPLGVNRHLAVTPGFLDVVLAEIARLGYRFVSMDDAVDRIVSRSRERFVVVTADDGYRDNLTEALPVLEKHGAPVTIYVAPGLVDGAVDLWWEAVEHIVSRDDRIVLPGPGGDVLDAATMAEKREANRLIQRQLTTDIPEQEQGAWLHALAAANRTVLAPANAALLGWDELRRMAAHPLVTIGAHTVHHYNLKRLPAEAALWEMQDSARIIGERLGRAPRHFAYPYGYESAVGSRELALAREAGFASAVTTRHGLIQPEHVDHMHALPRISLNGRYQKVPYVRTMLTGISAVLANRGHRVVTV